MQYKSVLVSNLVWIWEHGDIGNYDVDHINADPMDNRPENLQLLTHKENLRKRKGAKNQ